MSSQKGGKYERELCVRFSLWWSGGSRDDLFWRSSGSGARAKSRGHSNRRTHGQHGDMAPTHPSGEPLVDLVTIEIKRGYSKHTIADVLDRPPNGPPTQQQWDKWHQQVTESAAQAGSFSWLMIQRRDKRDALVFMPLELYQELHGAGCFHERPRPFLRLQFYAIHAHGPVKKKTYTYHEVKVVGILLEDWLTHVSPDVIKRLVKRV